MAANKWELYFDADAFIPAASNHPDRGVLQNRSYLAFDDTNPETCYSKAVRVPDAYAGGTVTIGIAYCMASATSGTAVYEVAVEAFTEAHAVNMGAATGSTTSFDTVNSYTETVPGTAGYLSVITGTLTNKDSMAAGDYIRISIARDADDGTNVRPPETRACTGWHCTRLDMRSRGRGRTTLSRTKGVLRGPFAVIVPDGGPEEYDAISAARNAFTGGDKLPVACCWCVGRNNDGSWGLANQIAWLQAGIPILPTFYLPLLTQGIEAMGNTYTWMLGQQSLWTWLKDNGLPICLRQHNWGSDLTSLTLGYRRQTQPLLWEESPCQWRTIAGVNDEKPTLDAFGPTAPWTISGGATCNRHTCRSWRNFIRIHRVS